MHALNLWFYHNRMINGHAFISITEVQGGEICIFGNTALSLPGSEDGWTIFKISSGSHSLSRPLYVFNNSWQVDFDMIGSPRNVWENSYLQHFNNACISEASDTFGIYNLGDHNSFDYDCSNVPFPSLLTSKGFEKHGLVADPLFRDPYNNDFRLKEDSPCIDRGKKSRELILEYSGRRPDIGAYDNDELIRGIPFRYMNPGVALPYTELPRITRIKTTGKEMRIWFSLPMDRFTLKLTQKSLLFNGHLYPLDFLDLSEDGYCLTLKGRGLPETNDPSALRSMELVLSQWPQDTQGRKLTTWASEIRVSLN